MSENDSKSGSPGSALDVPDAIVGKSRGFSPIWLIPVAVAAVAFSLAYQSYQNRGANIVVVFDSAEGLVAGKSKVKYRDVEIGTVELVRFRDLEHIEVHCSMDKGAVKYLTEDATWWVVRPRLTGAGISGLETIVSGTYLTFEPGKPDAKPAREFTGLLEPPIPSRDKPGLEFVLHTDKLGGIDRGSSVFYRNIEVGDVLDYELAEDGKIVDIRIAVMKKYAHLVTNRSRFWNAGGIDISVGPGGLDLKTESVQSILTGGVAFDSPGKGKPAANDDAFWLHDSWASVHKTPQTHGGLGLVLVTGSLGGVAAGNPVYYREVPVGSVVSHELSKDGSQVRIKVNIERRYASLVRHNSVFWNASGITADLGLTGLHVHAESLKSLLAGGVAFATPPSPGHTVAEGSVFHLSHEAKKKWMEWETDYEPKSDDPPEKHGALGRFFHHEDKSEEEAKQADPTPEPTADEHKHGFLHKLFHRKD